MTCKETACSSCAHLEVCSLRNEFLKAQSAVDDVIVHLTNGSMKKLRDYNWITTPDLRCKHYMKKNGGYSEMTCKEKMKDAVKESFLDKTMHIKDSGNRTEFATGAVRDMREGKGRCDLMPLAVARNILCTDDEQDMVMLQIANFMGFPDTTLWLYSALDHFTDKAYEGSPQTMLLEVAKHFEEGAKKYGENNWQKGIPVHCYIDSAVRHYLKWLRGDTDEPHDRAFVWNLMCCIWEVDYREKEEVE